MSALNLPSDVVHEILVKMPDFTTLLATIQSCRMFNDAFKVHPRSIVHEVLVNIAGPAVPQAARCAQYKEQFRRGDGLDVDQLPSEEHYRSLDWMPNKALANTLEENHKAVRILEDFYSQRCAALLACRELSEAHGSPDTDLCCNRNKDRTSSTSQLEPQESLRFQRAMYRYWLYLDMLTEGAFEPDDEFDDADDDDNDDDDFEERRDKYFREGFKKFLVCLSTDELLEVLSAGAFCEETMQWQSRGLPNETGWSKSTVFTPSRVDLCVGYLARRSSGCLFFLGRRSRRVGKELGTWLHHSLLQVVVVPGAGHHTRHLTITESQIR